MRQRKALSKKLWRLRSQKWGAQSSEGVKNASFALNALIPARGLKRIKIAMGRAREILCEDAKLLLILNDVWGTDRDVQNFDWTSSLSSIVSCPGRNVLPGQVTIDEERKPPAVGGRD